MITLNRRQTLASILATFAAGALPAAAAAEEGLSFGPAEPFSFAALKDKARVLAARPWKSLASPYGAILDQIDYDAYQKIRFRKEASLWADDGNRPPVQLFHLGRYFQEPARIYAVGDGAAREILYRRDYFDMPQDHVARQLPDDIGYGGFRVMNTEQDRDWLAFLGAAYFRSSGELDQYGLSARAVAIDTALPTPEEFPRFTAFYMEPAGEDANRIIINAILEGPSIAGAVRLDCRRDKAVLMDVDCAFYARKDIARLGVAPLTSMFWFGQIDRTQGVDWRPRIHDSEGLSIWTGADEHIWRPLANPHRVMTNSFLDKGPRGFGLLQRHRNFEDYQDDGVFYERRPSVWVEPLGDWGAGSIQLIEIPTDDEIHDNIVAYWVSDEPVKAGEAREWRYRLHWTADEPFRPSLATVENSFSGSGGVPGQPRPKGVRKFVVDFVGGPLASFKRGDLSVRVWTSRGEVRGETAAYPVVNGDGRWRAIFDIAAPANGPDPVDLRMALVDPTDKVVTESWVYQYFPESSNS